MSDNEHSDEEQHSDDDHASPYGSFGQPSSLNLIDADAVARAIEAADCVLIAAGAGLSASAGLDYNDEKFFREHFPAMVKRGFRRLYDFVGLPAENYSSVPGEGVRVAWAYRIYSTSIILGLPKHPVYESIFDAIKKKDYFALSSNVDGLFERNGFDAERLYTPQGDWRYYQCLNQCKPDSVYDSAPLIAAILPQIDHATMTVPASAIPKCARCGADVSFNVRGGSWFNELKYEAQARRFTNWIKAARGKKLLVFDIGSGFNTPTVCRYRSEQIALSHPNATFIRVNKFHPQLHATHPDGRAFSMPIFADEFAASLNEAIVRQRNAAEK